MRLGGRTPAMRASITSIVMAMKQRRQRGATAFILRALAANLPATASSSRPSGPSPGNCAALRSACQQRTKPRSLPRPITTAICGTVDDTVVNWVGRFRETGSVAAKPMGGDHRSRLTQERGWILQRIEAEPDLTVEEIRSELKERGVSVGVALLRARGHHR